MSDSKKIVFFGYSGHAYVAMDVALSNKYTISGYFDKNKAINNPYKISYFGNEEEEEVQEKIGDNLVFPAIGSNGIRQKVVDFIIAHDLNQTTLIDASAIVSSLATIGLSTLLAPGTVVNSMAHIGNGCIINTSAIVEHESKIGNFTHLAPGVVLAGNVRIGNNVFLGANSVVKQGITIGDNAIIGAGAVVLKDVPNGEVWVGNPAKRLR